MSTNINVQFILNIVTLIFSVLSFIASIGCIAYVVGLRNSTHKIEWKPIPVPGKSAVAKEEEEELFEEPSNF